MADTTASTEARAKAYSHGRYALFFAGELWSFAILVFLLRSGIATRMGRRAAKIARRAWLAPAVFFADFVVAVAVLDLPLSLYGSYFREKAWGFARQSLLGWFGDWAKGLAVSIVVGGIFVVAAYAIVRRAGKRWWIPVAAVAIAFTVIGSAVEPVFIAPLFNKFTPLPDSPLKREILNLARSQGIPARQVYEVDASRQSGHTNAYMAGLFGTQRIVLYDTILKSDTPREILAVLGHEMGHYKLHHVWEGIAFASLLIAGGLWLTSLLFPRLAGRFGPRCRIDGVADPAGLPLLALIAGVLGFLAMPLANAVSRRMEAQADLYSLRVVGDPDALISDFEKFHSKDLSEMNPPPFIELWLYSHPSLSERIAMCEKWRREQGSDHR